MRIRCAGCKLPAIDITSQFAQQMDIQFTCSECGSYTTVGIGFTARPEIAIPPEHKKEFEPSALSPDPGLRLFQATFEELAGPGKNDVDQTKFIDKLVQRGITLQTAKEWIQLAMRNGIIYERRHGFLARA